MGGVASYVDRRCCGGECTGSGKSEAAQMSDGRTMWTLDGIDRLPNGVACLYVLDSGIEPPLPEALLSMMAERSRAEEFRLFCGRLLNFGPASLLDLKEALTVCAPGFASTDIDVYLSAKLADDITGASGRWFIFVDRQENDTFIPARALKLSQKSSMVQNMLRSVAYELVQTKEGHKQPSFCDHGDVDFSGSWAEVANEGDMDAFFRDMGWTKMARRISSSIDHGVGRSEQHIDQKGDWICVTQISVTVRYTSAFHIGGGVQNTVNAEGKVLQVKPSWADDGKAIVAPHWDVNGDLMQVTKRYLRSNPEPEMVIEMTSPTGITVKRIWVPLRSLEDAIITTP